MDASEIARLIADQDSVRPLKLRYGTVKEAPEQGPLSIVADGETDPIPAIRCCDPLLGDRVAMLVNGTEWLAIATIGKQCPYRVGDVWITMSSDNPTEVWPGTTWKRIQNSFLLSSGSRVAHASGGEETHKLSVEELPAHSHALAIYNSNWTDVQKFYSNSVAWGAWTSSKVRLAHPSSDNISTGGNGAHNNMPPYLVANMWERTA